MVVPAYGYGAPGYGPALDPTNVIGRRIGAFFIDAVVVIALAVVMFMAVADRLPLEDAMVKYDCTFDLPRRFSDREARTISCPDKLAVRVNDEAYVAPLGSIVGVSLLFSFAYFVVLVGLTGWTLGKLATGVRVVDRHGRIAGIGRSTVRWLLFLVDGPLTLYLCGLITSLVSRGHRRVGDMVAGPYVVRADAVGSPVLDPPPRPYAAAPVGAPGPAGAPPPQWDAARGTYLQWDPTTSSYLQWDAARQTWHPLDR